MPGYTRHPAHGVAGGAQPADGESDTSLAAIAANQRDWRLRRASQILGTGGIT